MSEVAESRFGVTADDLRRFNWQERLATSARKECYGFFQKLFTASKEHEAAGDDLGFRVFSLLQVVASFHPNYDQAGNPYGSIPSGFDGKRPLNAEDLSDADLQALSGVLSEIEDPEFRARVGDVLWVTRRDFKAACVAISAFLESAERLKTDDLWPPYTERLERAAQLSAKRGFEKQRETVVKAVEAAIAEFESNPNAGLLCHRLMMILLHLEGGDATHYAALSERLAKDLAAIGNWHFAEAYWNLAAQWHRRGKNESEVHRCLVAAAECHVSRAEAGASESQPKLMYAAHWMGQGLEALRRAKADPARVAVVHRRFLQLQKESLQEMETFDMPFDECPGFREEEARTQEAAVAFVRGHEFQNAIARLANISEPTKLEGLKARYEKTSKDTIYAKLLAVSAVDRAGKIAGVLPPVGSDDPEVESENLRKRLTHDAKTIDWPLQVGWKIEPARIAMLEEHAVRQADLVFLVWNNPFIPEGHEAIYLHGLQEGFFGDWLTSLHLLIPQVEASIRYVLQQYGVITSTLKSDGTQEEWDLNRLLVAPEAEQIFGPDIVFDLRGLLTERFGYNLRNELAHGLMPEEAFCQASSVYLWWLILHLCWKGFRMVKLAEYQDQGAEDSAATQPK